MKIVLFVKDLNIGGVTKVVVNHINNVIKVDDEVLILKTLTDHEKDLEFFFGLTLKYPFSSSFTTNSLHDYR